MFLAVIGAALLGLLVWGIGTIFDTDPKNRNARLAGFIVFIVGAGLVVVGNMP